MLTCSNCGATIREGAKFCTACGTRLNDTSASTSEPTNWESSPAPASDVSTANTDAGAATKPDSTQSTSVWGSSVSDTPSPGATSEAVDDSDASAKPFNWAWGKQDETDADSASDAIDQVDEESGTVIDEAEVTTSDDSSTTVDATEIEILEDDVAMTDNDQDASKLTSSKGAEGTNDEPASQPAPEEGAETLAAWAEQWESAGPDGDETTGHAKGEDTAVAAAKGDSSGAKKDNDDEDTVAKAERLIGDLRALIPNLIRPKPSQPGASGIDVDSSGIADELESAARVGQFDDLRDALLAARDNPRDVDNVLSLANKVDRMLELLDDRNNLAKTAESTASRLRGGSKRNVI